jgi:hypothetical protein
METVGFRCPVGFKNYPADVGVSAGAATVEGGRGVGGSLDRAANQDSMTESDTQRQEFGAQSVNYSAVGQRLLRGRFERHAADFGTRLGELAKIAEAGEFGYAELEELYGIQEQLNQTVHLVEDVGGLDGAKTMREGYDGGATVE